MAIIDLLRAGSVPVGHITVMDIIDLLRVGSVPVDHITVMDIIDLLRASSVPVDQCFSNLFGLLPPFQLKNFGS